LSNKLHKSENHLQSLPKTSFIAKDWILSIKFIDRVRLWNPRSFKHLPGDNTLIGSWVEFLGVSCRNRMRYEIFFSTIYLAHFMTLFSKILQLDFENLSDSLVFWVFRVFHFIDILKILILSSSILIISVIIIK
jgi:hypothetical protein